MKKTLLQIWKNKGQILEGITNTIFKKEHIEEVYVARMEVCDGCEQQDTVGDKCAAKGTQPCCTTCGCSLRFKLRSMSSSCPLNKWEAVLSEAEEDLLTKNLNR